MTDVTPDVISTMQELVKNGADMYTCLRGPRPSAAYLFVIDEQYHSIQYTQTTYFKLRGLVLPPMASQSCKEVGECMMEDGHCVRNNHAEVDALLKAAMGGFSTAGSVMYTINKPCYQCTRALIAAQVKTVFYAYAVYNEQRTNDAVKAAGLEMIHVPV